MFHRFHIGTMAATIVSDGPLRLHAPAKIFLGPEPAALSGALVGAGQPTDVIRVEQNCLLLETAGKKVLFDNGLGSERIYGPDSGRLLDSLREAGVAPSEIDAVVLTHAHSDHCWGTMADDGTPNFPNATLYLSREELDFWTSDHADARSPRSIAGVAKHILPLCDRIRLIGDEGGVHSRGARPRHARAYPWASGVSVRWWLVPYRRRRVPRPDFLHVSGSGERLRYRP